MSISARSTCVALVLVGALTAACGDDGGGDADARVDQADASSSVDGAPSPDAPAAPDAALFDAPFLDPDGAAVDGAPSADADPADGGPTGAPILNEIVLDNANTDNNEFIEIIGTPSTDYSAYTVLQIDGDDGMSTNPGLIITTHPCGTTDANGYQLISVPSNTFQNGSQSMLLVYNYTAASTDIDGANDGVIDTTPWDALVDAVGILDGKNAPGRTDKSYGGAATLHKTFGTGNEPVEFGGASRIPDGTDTNNAGDWVSNTPNFDNTGIQSGEARNTPGAVNSVEP